MKSPYHAQFRLTSALIIPHLFEACVNVDGGAGMALASRVLLEGMHMIVEATMKVSLMCMHVLLACGVGVSV